MVQPPKSKSHEDTPAVICPNCRYALMRGDNETVASEICCSECGEVFNWGQVERLNVQPWMLETQVGGSWAMVFLRTVLTSFMPRRFWRHASLEEDEVRLRPIVVAVVLPLILLAVLSGLAIYLFAISYQGGGKSPVGEQWAEFVRATGEILRPFAAIFSGLIVSAILMPVAFLAAGSSRRAQAVGAIHLWRVMWYSLIWPSWLILLLMLPFLYALMRNDEDLAIYCSPYIVQILFRESISAINMGVMVGVTLIFGGLVSWWWWQAARLYLGLADAGRVTLLALVLSLAGAFAVQFWLAVG